MSNIEECIFTKKFIYSYSLALPSGKKKGYNLPIRRNFKDKADNYTEERQKKIAGIKLHPRRLHSRV